MVTNKNVELNMIIFPGFSTKIGSEPISTQLYIVQ